MCRNLLLWTVLSLIIPLLVLITGSTLNGLAFIFWPGVIMLMSLGAEASPFSDVVYAWSMAIGSNMVLYSLIGFVIHKVFKKTVTP